MLSAIRPPIIADLFICNVSIRLNPADGNDVDVAKGVYTKEYRIFIREYSLEINKFLLILQPSSREFLWSFLTYIFSSINETETESEVVLLIGH